MFRRVYNLYMRNKVFIILFGLSIVSILAYILLNLGSNTSTIDYLGFSLIVGTYFVFLSLPFLLAYFLGWGKVFSLSILTSLIALLVVTTYLGGIRAGEGWTFVYNTFFALFSVLYLFIASLVFGEIKKPGMKSLLLIVLVVIGWSILTLLFKTHNA